jgi:hypothetical protein
LNMRKNPTTTAIESKLQELPPYVEGALTEFWKGQGVMPISVTPCSEGEQGFSWSEFINGLGRRTQERDGSIVE